MNILEQNLIFLTIVAFFNTIFSKYKETRNIQLIISVSSLALINALRYPLIGTDMERYNRFFNYVGQIRDIKSFMHYDQEIGYKALQWIIYNLFGNFQLLVVIVSLIFFMSFYVFLKRYSTNYYFSLLLFITLELYDFTFSGVRQTLALALIMSSYHFAIEKKPGKFIVTTLLASSFHSTAIIFLPVYFIYNFRLKQSHIFFLIPFFVFFYNSRAFIGRIFNFIYYDSFETWYSSHSGFSTLALFLIVIVVMGLTFESPMRNKNDRFLSGSINIVIISIFIQVLSSYAYSFTRLNYYFLIIIIVYIPRVLTLNGSNYSIFNNNIEKIVKIILSFCIIISIILFYLNAIKMGNVNALPYYFFWN
ncbi:EpsG family protein [Ruoffia sp. FAM 26255]|uniref:EpsG family protein n=1 Tax=Ruoffia sp. FAM 26255 TaxID=3259519 RepID=UPI00388560A8